MLTCQRGARSSPSSSASAGSSSSHVVPRIRSSVGSANWAELLESDDSSAANTTAISSFPATSAESPPTSPDTSLTKVNASELMEKDATKTPCSSGSSSRVLRARVPEKANLLSFFKPASPFKRLNFVSSESDSSDSDLPHPGRKSKRKRKRSELRRPSKRLALAGPTTAPKDARPKFEQLYLDPFETSGHSTLSCAVCNMSYARTPEDLALHDKHHKRVVGGCDWTTIDGPAVTVLEDSVELGTSRSGKVLMVDALAEGILGRKVRRVPLVC